MGSGTALYNMETSLCYYTCEAPILSQLFFAFELFLAASIPEHKDADTNIAPSSVLYRGKGTKVLLKVFPYNRSAGLEACSQVGVDCNNTSGVGLSPHSYTSSHLFFL